MSAREPTPGGGAAAALHAAQGATLIAMVARYGTDEEKAARKEAISDAASGAARPPMRVIVIARKIVDLAGELIPIGNRNLITDLAAAGTSRVNIEINRPSVKDSDMALRLSQSADDVDAVQADADRVTEQVREVIRR